LYLQRITELILVKRLPAKIRLLILLKTKFTYQNKPR